MEFLVHVQNHHASCEQTIPDLYFIHFRHTHAWIVNTSSYMHTDMWSCADIEMPGSWQQCSQALSQCELNKNALFTFLLGTSRGQTTGPVNYTPVPLELSVQNHCSFAVPFVLQYLRFPLHCFPSCPQVEHFEWTPQGEWRIGLSFYKQITVWEFDYCLYSTNS